MCEHAVRERPDDPANWINLVEVLMMANRRVKAINTIDDALKRFPKTKLLQDLRTRIGMRRTPVIPFLHRNNVMNQVLGHMRHTWLEKRATKPSGKSTPAR